MSELLERLRGLNHRGIEIAAQAAKYTTEPAPWGETEWRKAAMDLLEAWQGERKAVADALEEYERQRTELRELCKGERHAPEHEAQSYHQHFVAEVERIMGFSTEADKEKA